VAAATLETRELLLHGAQVLKTGERDGDQREAPAEVERRHVGNEQPRTIAHLRRLMLKRGAAALEHVRRKVEPGDVVPGACEGDQHAPGPATELEQRAVACIRGHRPPEGNVVALAVDGIVDRGELGGLGGGVVIHRVPRFAQHPQDAPSRVSSPAGRLLVLREHGCGCFSRPSGELRRPPEADEARRLRNRDRR
jgi:hypothetical protein